jgi:hypothetical protein
VRVHLAVEHPLQLETAYAAFEAGGFALDVLRRGFVVLAFGQLEQLGSVGDRLRGAIELRKLGSQFGAFAPQFLGLVRLLPDGRVFQLAIYFLEALFLGVVLKETPVETPYGLRGL